MSYFVLLWNPSNGARFALVKSSDQDVAEFDTYRKAQNAAKKTLFGDRGFYDIYDMEETAYPTARETASEVEP